MQIVETIKKERNNKLWAGEDGYFTVEASFLVTLVWLLVLAVIMTGLYICDLNQAKSFLHERVTELSRDDTAYENDQQQADYARIKSQLFITNVVDFSISKSSNKVEGAVELSMKLNIPLMDGWFGKIWGNSFSLSAEVGNNAEKMRRWTLIE